MRTRLSVCVVALMGVLVALMGLTNVWAGPRAVPLSDGTPPLMMSYQGVLTDPATGEPVPDGDYEIRFALYDTESGWGSLWTELQTVTVTDGLFSILLGSDKPLSADHFTGTTYLGVKVGTEAWLTPRQRIVSVPYAIHALEATNSDTVDGQDASAFAAAGHSHDSDYWSLTGNSGTISGTHFLGTTDDVALELRVNGVGGLRLEPNSGAPNVVAGSSGNSAAGVEGAAIGGGGDPLHEWFNTVSGSWATIGGGRANSANALCGTIGGGEGNTADAAYATVGGGLTNTARQPLSTVSGGSANTASWYYSAVGGGYGNTASEWCSTIGGGQDNSASGESATVGGGYDNEVRADYATIAGGGRSDPEDETTGNCVTDNYGTVGGGGNNQAGDGTGSTDDAAFATVGGGVDNRATGERSTVAGGWSNSASGYITTIGGGQHNSASEERATIGGGANNTAEGSYAVVGGGRLNSAVGGRSTVGGGENNASGDWYATVAGGRDNAAGGNSSVVGGGYENAASANNATVGGGHANSATSAEATVAGGGGNSAEGEFSTVAGGRDNTAGEEYASVAGGWNNQATARYAAIGGGLGNTANGFYATVAGGRDNSASGESATVGGGGSNSAEGQFSFAAGYLAQATHYGSFVWSGGGMPYASGADREFRARAPGGVYFHSNSHASTGVHLAAGGTSWQVVSDRAIKENYSPVDGEETLRRLASLPISTWNLKSQDPSIRHIGPVAQDFHAAFGYGESDSAINMEDSDGVALTAIQALYDRSQEQAERIEALEEENTILQRRLDDLEALVAALANEAEGGAR